MRRHPLDFYKVAKQRDNAPLAQKESCSYVLRIMQIIKIWIIG